MRLFTAIDVPAGIKQRLRDLIDRLRPAAKLKWSPVDNLHVTLKFIGEWPEPRLQELKETIASIPSPGQIEVAVRGLGWFPNSSNPKVLFAGIEASPALKTLVATLDTSLAQRGVPAEQRDFHPHLTLARRRDPVPIEPLRRIVESLPADFGAFSATAFSLYLSAAGKYTKLQEVPLVGPAFQAAAELPLGSPKLPPSPLT